MRCASVLMLCTGSSAAAQWQAATPAPVIRSRAAGAIVGGSFYLMGGETTSGARDVTCFRFDIASNTWSPIADMPSIRIGNGGVSNVDAAAVGTDVYLPGGWSGLVGHNRLLRYDTANDMWTEIGTDPVPTAIYAATVTEYDGRVYVFGGSTASGRLNLAGYVYDPAGTPGTRWDALPGAPTPRQYASGVALNGKIYVFGGIGAVSNTEYATVDVYDAGTNKWSIIPAMSTARGGLAAFNRNGALYSVAGGWATYLTTGELSLGGAWGSSDPCNTGLRTMAHDADSNYLVKACGWEGTYRNVTEIFVLDRSCPCVCNYDTSTGPGVCDSLDFLAFENEFVRSTNCACNSDTGTGIDVCDIFDFLAFQNNFAGGCP
jgi:hypothetical protein